ncbi:hypothetical protein [Halogranum rubrum]|uniref:Uncharacterized protein n=1 Tax=Halogranum salarium B-1 TaxID=1210908 RepID=J2ZZF6_9EURY|nr:hypothetical protein [Halogranum salarium]EJN58428.1 hypothetical protein HSB1_38450 [Halogranum salarium B-1]
MRTPDTLDYAFIVVLTVLVYIHLPWRPAIRRGLRSGASTAVSIGNSLFPPSPESIVVAVAAIGVVLLVVLFEVLPRRNGP